MSKSQRTKGHAFEREVVRSINLIADAALARNIQQSRDGGNDIDWPPFKIECKRRKSIALVSQWMAQVEAACKEGDIPAVVLRQDHGEAYAVIPLPAFARLVAHWQRTHNTEERLNG